MQKLFIITSHYRWRYKNHIHTVQNLLIPYFFTAIYDVESLIEGTDSKVYPLALTPVRKLVSFGIFQIISEINFDVLLIFYRFSLSLPSVNVCVKNRHI